MQTFVSQHTETDVIDRLHTLFGKTNEDTLAAVYDKIVQKTNGQNVTATSATELAMMFRRLNLEQEVIKHSVPNSFALADAETIDWLYQPDAYTWSNLQRFVALPEVRSATLFTPMGWQFGSLFYNHCRNAQVITSIFDSTGFPSVELLLKNYPVDLLVTSNSGLQQCLESDIVLPDKIIVIVPWGETPSMLAPGNKDILYEIHLYPAFPIAEATSSSVADSFSFTPTTEYLFTLEGDTAFISSLTPTPVPLLNYRLPGKILLQESGTSHYRLQYE